MFFQSLSFVDDLKVHSKEIKMTFNNTQDAGMILGMVLGHKCRINLAQNPLQREWVNFPFAN